MRHDPDVRPAPNVRPTPNVPPPPRCIRLTFGSDPGSVRQAQEQMLESLRHTRLAEDDISSLQIVVAEVLNNIVEHAHRNRRGGRISMRVLHAGGRSLCAFVDDGAAMPGNRPPDGRPVDPRLNRGALPEGGFGWFLIRRLTDDFRYRRFGGRNHLALRLAGREARSDGASA